MQPVSLVNLPDGLSDVMNALRKLNNSSEENNWELIRKAESRDLLKFWSSSMLSNIEYAERIKEYADLPKPEKISMFLKNYPVFAWLPYIFKSYELGLEGVPLGDGSYLPSDEQEYEHLEPEWRDLYGQVGRRLTAEGVAKMKEMALTKEEYLLLRAAALLSPDESLSPPSLKTVEAVNSSLRAAILLNKTPKFMADVDELFRKLGDIGIFEKENLLFLAPNGQQQLLMFLGVTGA